MSALDLDQRFLRRLDSLALAASKLRSGRARGEHGSTRAGSGVAFAGHRPYTAGDDLRFVDWQLFARSDRLYVKQHEEERDLAVHLLLDCSASMAEPGDGRKLAFAKQLCAALGYIALTNLDRVSVHTYADGLTAQLPPLRGRHKALSLLRFLARQEASGSTSLVRAAEALRARAPGGGLALIISDGEDRADLLRAVDILRHARLTPSVLLLVHPEERAPTLRGEHTLIDAESGEEHTLHIDARVLEAYRHAREQHERAIVNSLGERQVVAQWLSLELSLEHTVLTLLRRSGVVI